MSDDHVTPYLARLPIGERPTVPADGLPSWSIFPFEGELRVKVLEAPELPEPSVRVLTTYALAGAHGCSSPARSAATTSTSSPCSSCTLAS